MYLKIFKDSWIGLRNNLILFLPDLLLILGFLVFSGLLLLLISVFPGFETFSGITEATNVEQIKELVLGFIKLNPLKVLFSVLLFLAVTIFYGATTNVWKFNMMKDIANKKKAGLKRSFKEIKDFYWKFIGVNFIIILITFLAAFLIIVLAYFIKNGNFWRIINTAVLTLVGLVFVYKEAVLFLEKKGAIRTVRDTFRIFLNKTSYVFLTWLIVFAFSIGLSLLFILASYFKINIFLIILGITGVVLSVWADLFFFYAYKFRNS